MTHLLMLPKQFSNWKSNVQICEPMGVILIRTTTLTRTSSFPKLFLPHQSIPKYLKLSLLQTTPNSWRARPAPVTYGCSQSYKGARGYL